MSSLVFLVEEPSMKGFLDGLLPRLLPPVVTHAIVPHGGKSELIKSIPRKLKAWGEPDARFVVLIDQDSHDCRQLKKEIMKLCPPNMRDRVLVRIVCRCLESWTLSDLRALEDAFGKAGISARATKKNYRNPDNLGDPLSAIRALGLEYQKGSGARAVGSRVSIDPERNQSVSFRVFLNGMDRFIPR